MVGRRQQCNWAAKEGSARLDGRSADAGENGFFLSELVTEDSVNFVELIDSNGCVTKTPLVQSLERVSRTEFRVEVVFGGFPDQSEVTYQTLVKSCLSEDCEVDCNAEYYRNGSM